MGFSYNVNVLNQKGSPAIYTDTFANRPAFGFAGRLFIANDTAAIYEDTGTSWVLIANVSSGAGTLQQVTTNGNTSNVGISVTAGGGSTNSATITSLTQGSVPFVGAAGLITQDNTNLFFDDTNNRLGINTNTPTNNLDVHGSGTIPIIAINNTAGNQSLIGFAKNSTAKWRIGNSSTDTFDVLNVGLTTNAISINSASNCVSFLANLLLKQGTGFQSIATFNGIACDAGGFFFSLGTSTNTSYLNFIGLTAARTFTFPDAAGTLALTSNIPTVSGTNNKVVKFTSASTIGDSNITDTGTFVGINNSTPTTTLDVVGSGLFSGSLTANAGTLNSTLSVTGKAAFNAALGSEQVRINQTTANNSALLVTTTAIAAGQSYGLTVVAGTNASDRSFAVFSQSNAEYFRVNGNGFVGIGTATPAYSLVISNGGTNGLEIDPITGTGGGTDILSYNRSTALYKPITMIASSYAFNTGAVTIQNLAGTGSRVVIADATGLLSAPVSDQTVKENIQPLQYGLNAIMQLNPISFEYINEYKNYGEGLQIGNIAQDVAKVIPEAVFTTPSTGLMGINYNQFDGIYIKAIQELNQRIELLLSRIEYLENK